MTGFPILTAILLAPVVAAIFMIFIPREEGKLIKCVAAVGTFVALVLSLYVYFAYDKSLGGLQFVEKIPWITDLGVSYFMAVDGISSVSYTHLDVYKRQLQSLRIIEQALEQLPEGPIVAKVPKVIKPPAGDAFAEIESAKGLYGAYVVSDGSAKPYRVHFRRPSFINLAILGKLCKGWKIADVIAIFGSIDVVMGEVDC